MLKTTTGAIIGTPTYMSPEQCRGIGQTSDRSDVFAGLHAVPDAVRAAPFQGDGSGDPSPAHRRKPQQLRELVPNVGPEIETPCTTCWRRSLSSGHRCVRSQSLEQLGHWSTASGPARW